MKGAKEVRIFYYRYERFKENLFFWWIDQIKSTWFSLLPIERQDLAVDKMLIVRNKNNQFIVIQNEKNRIENIVFFFSISILFQARKTLEKLRKACPAQMEMDGLLNLWIIKPGCSSRGRGISISNRYMMEQVISINNMMEKQVIFCTFLLVKVKHK